jgi:hypothetical protein
MPVTRLIWGVKQSFRTYVEASGGTIGAGAGAERMAEGVFAFAAAAGSDLAVEGGVLAGTGRFRGQVSFQAHGGLLSVTLVDPWVEATAGGWALSVAETAGSPRRMTIAKLDAGALALEPDGTTALPAATTLEGMMLLGDHYPPGTALDPVRLDAG